MTVGIGKAEIAEKIKAAGAKKSEDEKADGGKNANKDAGAKK